ncbi:MAG TPA: AMP-binding protein [Rudaea sp.]|uniref:AMP-binding protein n=1 Tax=Rudaea sp. TaxID=2136325 RepID=UPI002F9501F4
MQGEPSYVSGVSAVPLIGDTIGVHFDKVARAHADRDALIVCHQNIRWTYRDLRERVDNLAVSLRRLGLAPGERIGIWAPNCCEWTLTQFAAAKAGLILVNINPAYQRSELEYALNKVGCKALVLAPSFKASDYLEMLADLAPELARCAPGAIEAKQLPQLRCVIRLGAESTPGMFNFDALLGEASENERAELAALGASLQFDDPINIQFTSGTTGLPKGATLTHHNILNNGFFVTENIRLQPGDRLCIPVPLYHCFGMVMGNLGCLTHGATMVYADAAFDPKSVLAAIHAERCTALYGVPTMFIAELGHADFAKYDLSSLRTGIMAGSPCPIEVMKQVFERMHMHEVVIAYGMTETSPMSLQCAPDDPLERRVSTVGRISPHVEVKIVDTDGRIVPRGEPGELCTRGYSVMLGYWNDAEKTAEAVDCNGWMHTGDLATIDAEGYCNIVGRSKDMVIRGGENVYPREVEEFLYRHPLIQDVQCVGVPDAKFGEVLCACVILKAGASADEGSLRAFCRGEIAHYKVPQYIRFVEAFPMTVTGKVQKYILRQTMADELGLRAQKTA